MVAISLFGEVHLVVMRIRAAMGGHRPRCGHVANRAELRLLVNVAHIPSLILRDLCVIDIPPERGRRYLIVTSDLFQKVGCARLDL